MKLYFTIITVVFNDAYGLEQTIHSVIRQTYRKIEFIIIDGNSNDEIKEIIEEYRDHIDFFLSEDDDGIYDAMNKGIKNSNGDFIIFMNAGDIFASDNVLCMVSNKITDKETAYFGRALMIGEKNSWIHPPQKISDELKVEEWAKKYQPIHQSIFFPRSFYAFNKYDTSFKIIGDTEYKLRYLNSNQRFKFIDIEICHFQLGGISNRSDNLAVVIRMSLENIKLVNLYYHGLGRIVAKLKFVSYFVKFNLRFFLGKEKYQSILFLMSKLRSYI
jgi:glycosyltransferase involved in cell wall biosynthesis